MLAPGHGDPFPTVEQGREQAREGDTPRGLGPGQSSDLILDGVQSRDLPPTTEAVPKIIQRGAGECVRAGSTGLQSQGDSGTERNGRAQVPARMTEVHLPSSQFDL